jgi:hypothetical protein
VKPKLSKCMPLRKSIEKRLHHRIVLGGEQSVEHGNRTLTMRTLSGSGAENGEVKEPVRYLQNHALLTSSSQMYYSKICE